MHALEVGDSAYVDALTKDHVCKGESAYLDILVVFHNKSHQDNASSIKERATCIHSFFDRFRMIQSLAY